MPFAGLQAAVSEEWKIDENVIIGFHFILMPGSHETARTPNRPLGCVEGARRGPARRPRCPVWTTEAASTT